MRQALPTRLAWLGLLLALSGPALPQAEPVPVDRTPAVEAPLLLTLAEVCASIGDGFSMSDEFVTDVLRFEPAVRDGGELVFLPEQCAALLRKLVNHIEAQV